MLSSALNARKAPLTGRFLFGESVLAALGLAALFFSWLAPNHYPPWTSFHGEAAAFAALCLLAVASARQDLRPRLDGACAVTLFLLAVVWAQWIAGQIPYGGDALLSALYLIGAALAFRLGYLGESGGRTDPLSVLAAVLVAAVSFNVLIGVLQWHYLEQSLGIFAADRGPDMRVYGNLGQPNHLATSCLMGVVLALWLRHRALLARWQFVLLLAWLSLGLILTESRSGLLGAGAVGGVLLLGRRFLPRAGYLVAAWWLGLTVGHLLLPRLNAWMLLAPARSHELGSDNLRSVMWRQVAAAIEDAPWFGYGWRQTMFAVKKAAIEVPGRLPTDYAHNLCLDVLLWVGVPCGLLLLIAAAAWLVRRWWRIADARQLLLFAAAVPVLVHSQFEFPFAYAYFLFPVAWLLGALDAAQSRHAAPEPASGRLGLASALLMLGAYTALCLAVASEYLEAEEDYRVMRFELRRVGQVPAGYATPDLRLLTQLGELLAMGRLEPKTGMAPELLERLRVATERNGWATLDLNYATALGYNEQPEEASRRLIQLERVYGRESAEQAFAMFRAFQTTHPLLEGVRVP